jgi:hypothetical protein
VSLEVPVTRLDAFASGMALAAPALIRLDLQGYELEALKGATALLQRAECVLMETVFEPTCEGEPLFCDALRFMEAAPFEFRLPPALTRDERGIIVAMDAPFARNR